MAPKGSEGESRKDCRKKAPQDKKAKVEGDAAPTEKPEVADGDAASIEQPSTLHAFFGRRAEASASKDGPRRLRVAAVVRRTLIDAVILASSLTILQLGFCNSPRQYRSP